MTFQQEQKIGKIVATLSGVEPDFSYKLENMNNGNVLVIPLTENLKHFNYSIDVVGNSVRLSKSELTQIEDICNF